MRFANPFQSMSPYPTDPTFGFAAKGLADALFGNPAKRQAQQEHEADMALRAAQTDTQRAHGGLYGAQTRGVDIKNNAISGMPRTLADFFAPASSAPVRGADGDTPPAAPGPGMSVDQARAGLPGLIAGLIAADEGGNVDEIVNVLAALGGGDELARRGVIATGATPGEAFALTPERADNIRGQEFDNKIDLEKIQSSDRRYNTDVDSRTSRANNTDDNTSANWRHVTPDGNTRYKTKEGARVTNATGANVIAAALGADVVITDNARTDQANGRLSDSAPNSKHLDRNGAKGFDVRKVPGLSYADARRRVQAEAVARGGVVIESKEYNDHWHFAIDGVKAGSKPAVSATKTVKVGKDVSDSITTAIAERHNKETRGVRDRLVAMAIREFQKTGNLMEAVTRVGETWAQAKPGAGAKPAARTAASDRGGWSVKKVG